MKIKFSFSPISQINNEKILKESIIDYYKHSTVIVIKIWQNMLENFEIKQILSILNGSKVSVRFKFKLKLVDYILRLIIFLNKVFYDTEGFNCVE